MRRLVLILRNLVAYAYLVAVPASACIGQIECLGEVGFKIRLVAYACGAVVVLLLHIASVPF